MSQDGHSWDAREKCQPGMTHELVPGDPQTLVICVMSSFHPSDYPKRIVPGGDSANLFAREMNLGLKLVPAGSASKCSISYGPPLEAGLFFNYPDGDVLVVKLDDCPAATNGRRFAQVGAGRSGSRSTSLHPPTPGPSDAPASAAPSATPTGSVVVSQDVPRSSNSRYAVSPPSVGTVPTVSADQALKKAGLHRNPHLYIVLIVLTDKVFRNANGPVIDHRLVWYVEEAHVPCIPGSMGGCNHVQGAIVDATTGRRYFSFAGRPPGLKLPHPPGA